MTERKVDLFWVMIGFGLSYLFFGLTLIMDTYADWVKQVTGAGAIVCFIVFWIFAIVKFGKNDMVLFWRKNPYQIIFRAFLLNREDSPFFHALIYYFLSL